MTEQEINSIVIERLFAARTPFGRMQFRTFAAARCLARRLARHGSRPFKRSFDIAASLAALILLLPLFLAIGLLIKLEDRGPVFFRQTRVGKFGRRFQIYKFRSMCLDAEKRLQQLLDKNIHGGDGITFKIKDDPRITRVGKWLRKFSLDELPQFYNVLLGDMSLVGPRPPIPAEVARYTLADRRRLEVTPGITCFGQIGGRAEVDFSGQVQLDVLYIESQTFWIDVKILFKTIPAVLCSKGAY
jgi:lipopolysaccharide/colanic/teichoic acid biosynthesis glycosyltransferase